jgi:hypothetical protein
LHDQNEGPPAVAAADGKLSRRKAVGTVTGDGAQKVAPAKSAVQQATKPDGRKVPDRDKGGRRQRHPNPKFLKLAIAVEKLLDEANEGEAHIRAPLAATQIYDLLDEEHRGLTDRAHIVRSLLAVPTKLLYCPDHKLWWRRDRKLPPKFGDKPIKTYKRRETELSKTRSEHDANVTRAELLLGQSKRALSGDEICERLGIESPKRTAFKRALRRRTYYSDNYYYRRSDRKFTRAKPVRPVSQQD